jgi:hypothetical protein
MEPNQYKITATITEVSAGHISISCSGASTFTEGLPEPAYSIIMMLTEDIQEAVYDAAHVLSTLVGGEITHTQSVKPTEILGQAKPSYPPDEPKPRFDFGLN